MDRSLLDNTRAALAATLDPHTPHVTRLQALQHLETLKHSPSAPSAGFALAEDWHQPAAVRYYGLQLLEFSVRYRWIDYGAEQRQQLRAWVERLAGSLREADAAWVRSKTAQVWVELAKRCWGTAEEGDGEAEAEWRDMDAGLVSLWERPVSERGVVHKVFVLAVLEGLSEDIVSGEDAIAGLRVEVLGDCLNEVMVPPGVYEAHAGRKNGHAGSAAGVRCGEQGWFARVVGFFAECIKAVKMGWPAEMVRGMSECAVKALNALRPTMSWISLMAATEVNCVDALFLPFYTEDVALQTAATETLLALLGRPYAPHRHAQWVSIQQQALRSDRIALLRQTFDRTASAPGEDEAKYTLQKKMSELLSVLADAVAAHPELYNEGQVDVATLFDLLLYVLQSKSLVVSIPVLHSWSKMMAVQDTTIIDMVLRALGTLVQTCSERLLRYESLPSDSEDEIAQYLDEDFDTVPERHAFLGNYRRYCTGIVQAVARSRPIEALQYVLEQMRNSLETGPYTSGRGFKTEDYSRNRLPVLRFDAQFTVVSSAIRGFSFWCQDVAVLAHDDPLHEKAEQDRATAEQTLRDWSHAVISIQVDDPEVAAQLLQLLVVILRTIKAGQEFVLHVVQHLLTMHLSHNPAHATFSEAVRGFEGLRVVELQKLALAFATELLEVYHELEPRIGVLVSKHSDDAKLVWGYRAFLFMIIHRSTGLDGDMRFARLQQLLQPVYEAWRDPALSASASSLQSFCESLGMGDLPGFYKAYRFDQISDWSSQQLNEAGQRRQALVKERNDQMPLRMTKSMLAAGTERLRPDTDEFEVSSQLWKPLIPIILPTLLQMLRHAAAFHNLSNWSQLPDELQMVIKRTLQDRFWQSGISNESKDEFYARISGSKSSYEGFASTVRGTVRNVREHGYQVIYAMTRFDEHFYSFSELADPLADALLADADCLSANHLHPIINLVTGLVSRCPPHRRTTFLPPLLTKLFTVLDGKISSEWDAIRAANDQDGREDDELSDEMRMESVLRQLTYSMVSFVPFLLDYDRSQHAPNGNGSNGLHGSDKPTLDDLVLSDPTILEPMLLFCTHALRMRDTRCCTLICKVFRQIVPLFNSSDRAAAPQVREFLSTEVLKACITSLNEPYFADMQKDLAALIAQIISLYSRHTSTPRDVLLSLPDMSAAKVDKALTKIGKAASERQQRSLVLELLEGVRGVSIYEQGKIARATPVKGRSKAGVQERFMEVEQQAVGVVAEGDERGLEDIAGLFGEG